MTMFGFLRKQRRVKSADTARDRLQILLAHERTGFGSPDVLPLLQRDILDAIERRISIGSDKVDIRIERGDELSSLEINIELPGALT